MNISTPSVLVDLDAVEANLDRMADISKQNGVTLRPHVKTHKIPRLAKMQVEKGAGGITVAKVSEAEVMADHGLDDIFIAYPVIGEEKVRRLQALNSRVNLIAGVDSLEGAGAMARAFAGSGKTLTVRLEVDTGLKRTGVEYSQALALGRAIRAMEGLELTGIYTFRGPLDGGRPTLDREKAGLEEGRLMVALAEEFRKAGINVPDVSVGSTPTAEFAARVSGVTEIRPGTYIFNDMMQVRAGSCSLENCAVKVLTTVVSVPSAEHCVIDGGSKTFSTDIPPGVYPYFLEGHGCLVGYGGSTLARLTEEHGMIDIGVNSGSFQTGLLLKVIPNHVCTTINLHNRVYFVRGGEILEEVAVEGRGMVY